MIRRVYQLLAGFATICSCAFCMIAFARMVCSKFNLPLSLSLYILIYIYYIYNCTYVSIFMYILYMYVIMYSTFCFWDIWILQLLISTGHYQPFLPQENIGPVHWQHSHRMQHPRRAMLVVSACGIAWETALSFLQHQVASQLLEGVDQHSEDKTWFDYRHFPRFFQGLISVIFSMEKHRRVQRSNIFYKVTWWHGDTPGHWVPRPTTACWLMSLAVMRPCMQLPMVGMVGQRSVLLGGRSGPTNSSLAEDDWKLKDPYYSSQVCTGPDGLAGVVFIYAQLVFWHNLQVSEICGKTPSWA